MGCQSSKQIQQKNSEKSSNLSLKLVSQKKECIKSQKQSPSSNQSKSTVDFKPQDESIITKIIKKKKIGMDQLNAKSAQKQQLGLQFGKKLINNKFSSPDILSPKVLQTLEKNMIQYYNLQGDNMNNSPNINIKDSQIKEKTQSQKKQKRVKYTELLENLQLKKFQIKQEYDLFISPRNQQEQSEKISNFLQNLSKLMHPSLQSGQFIEYLYKQNDKINNKFQCFLNKNIQQSFIMRKRNIFRVNFSKRQNLQRSQTTALQSLSEQQNRDQEKKEYCSLQNIIPIKQQLYNDNQINQNQQVIQQDRNKNSINKNQIDQIDLNINNFKNKSKNKNIEQNQDNLSQFQNSSIKSNRSKKKRKVDIKIKNQLFNNNNLKNLDTKSNTQNNHMIQ